MFLSKHLKSALTSDFLHFVAITDEAYCTGVLGNLSPSTEYSWTLPCSVSPKVELNPWILCPAGATLFAGHCKPQPQWEQVASVPLEDTHSGNPAWVVSHLPLRTRILCHVSFHEQHTSPCTERRCLHMLPGALPLRVCT